MKITTYKRIPEKDLKKDQTIWLAAIIQGIKHQPPSYIPAKILEIQYYQDFSETKSKNPPISSLTCETLTSCSEIVTFGDNPLVFQRTETCK